MSDDKDKIDESKTGQKIPHFGRKIAGPATDEELAKVKREAKHTAKQVAANKNGPAGLNPGSAVHSGVVEKDQEAEDRLQNGRIWDSVKDIHDSKET